jgi:hypothetical protein
MFKHTIWSCGNNRIERKESLSTSVESKRSPIDRVETRRRSTQIDQCKRAFSTSVESKRSPIDRVETRFRFSVLVVRLSNTINQCKRAVSDAVPR